MKKNWLLGVIFALMFSGLAVAGGYFTIGLTTWTTLLGTERIPADTGLSSGAQPQTIAVTVNQLRGEKLQQSTPLAGFSITAETGTTVLEITPAGVLATGTFVFPDSAVDGQRLKMFSTQTVTALTLTAGAGQTINAAATALTGGTAIEYVYKASNLTWYRTM